MHFANIYLHISVNIIRKIWDQDAAGSSPVTSTTKLFKGNRCIPVAFEQYHQVIMVLLKGNLEIRLP